MPGRRSAWEQVAPPHGKSCSLLPCGTAFGLSGLSTRPELRVTAGDVSRGIRRQVSFVYVAFCVSKTMEKEAAAVKEHWAPWDLALLVVFSKIIIRSLETQSLSAVSMC